jgi:hypothetical protein
MNVIGKVLGADAAADHAILEAKDAAIAVESKTVADANEIADKVIAALTPRIDKAVDAINTVTLTVDASIVETLALLRRIDGAKVVLTLGREDK